MARPVSIADIDFPSKAAAIQFIQSLVARYDNEEPITGQDGEFVAALFRLHPRHVEKIMTFAAPILHFTVSTNIGGSRCFYAVLENGDYQDFSFKKCLNGAAAKQNQAGLHNSSNVTG